MGYPARHNGLVADQPTSPMARQKFLFIHQNFPGQFVHVAKELVRLGHEVLALGIDGQELPGVRYIRYGLPRLRRVGSMKLAQEFEAKIARGEACAHAMLQLKQQGFEPDAIVAHPGWGEALFCKDIWPDARLVVFAEYFYNPVGTDFAFDPEFFGDTPLARAELRLKNTVHLHALAAADAAYTPTQWQHAQLPPEFRHKVHVIFDGIDTAAVAPNAGARVTLHRKKLNLTPSDEIITFVNRNLEPYRGFHIFMRALPAILQARPRAHCIIVGKDEVSYGSKPAGGGTWRARMLAEVGDRLPADRVHFVGGLPHADYVNVLQVSSCHIYMTYPFVLSWSCVEAMSAGCTVVGSRTGPVQEVIEHGRNGLLVDFFDVEALAGQVADALADRPLSRRLGQAARQKAIQRYDLKSQSLPRQLELLLG